MAIATLSNSFRIQEVQTIKKFDVRLNIQKRRESIVFKSNTIQDNINLGYVISKEVNSLNNISISDKSSAILDNRIPTSIPISTFTGKSFSINNSRFKLTDIFTTETATQAPTPLFYKHLLQNFDSSDTSKSVVSVDILNQDKKVITVSELVTDLTSGYIYTNLVNNYNNTNGELKLYYIRYSVKDSSTSQVSSYTEIMNNEFVYHLATFDDLDSTTGLLQRDAKAYLLDEFASDSYEISVPTLKPYAVQREFDSKIELIPVPLSDTSNPWYLSVANGNFFTTLNTSPNTTNIFKYNIPEFLNQTFNPYFPFKLRANEHSLKVNNHVLKVLKNNIQLDVENLFNLQVILRNPDLTPRKAFTTDVSKIGTLFEDTIKFTNDIRSIDKLGGFIDLSSVINNDDVVETTYFYEEKAYEITELDFNPVSNLNILGNRIVFYITPNTNNARSNVLFYVVVDSLGKITFTNQTDNAELTSDIATNSFYYDKISPSVSELSFLDKYTVQARYDFKYANTSNPKYLVLGEVFTHENSHPRQTVTFDIRKAGGGIKEDNVDILIDDHPQLQYLAGVGSWNGLPYPGNGLFYIELPAMLQEKYGGILNDTAIREVVEQHVALGIYPLIDTYSAANVIPVLVPYTGVIKISWRSFPGQSYNLYYHTQETGTFTKANASPISDSAVGNIYNLTGLSSDTQYWIYVVLIDSNNIEIPNNIIGINPTTTNPILNKVSVKTYS